MQSERSKRIYALLHKAEAEGLTEEEDCELSKLRRECLTVFMEKFYAAQPDDDTHIADEAENKRPLHREN